MQAQAPFAPYYGLWSWLDGFTGEELSGLLTSRKAVRIGWSVRASLRVQPYIRLKRSALSYLEAEANRLLKSAFGVSEPTVEIVP